MKQVIISGAFFIIIIAALIFNSFYLHSMTAEMFEYIDALPTQIDDSDTKTAPLLHELTDFWIDHRELASLTVNYDYIATITLALHSVRELYEARNQSEYASAKYVLYESVLRLHELEKPTLSNII